jgi:hypothetical protein
VQISPLVGAKKQYAHFYGASFILFAVFGTGKRYTGAGMEIAATIGTSPILGRIHQPARKG